MIERKVEATGAADDAAGDPDAAARRVPVVVA